MRVVGRYRDHESPGPEASTASPSTDPRVLWVSLADEMSGAEHSLLEILRFARCRHAAAAPAGRFAERLRATGISPSTLPPWSPRLRGGAVEWIRSCPALWRLARCIAACAASGQAQVVVGNGLRAGMAASLAGTRLPVVWALRDNLPGGAAGRAAAALGRRVTLVANSRFIALQCGDHLHRYGRTVAIHPGIDWPAAEPRLRRELGIGAEIPLVGVVGQIAPWKRQWDAVEAARLARRAFPELRLVVVGTPKFRAENRAYFERLRRASAEDGGRTLLLGERADLHRIYPDLNLLLVPSEGEPFGRVAAEALGYGVPVLAADGGGLPEIVAAPARGRLIPIGDIPAWAEALRAMLARPQRLSPAEVAAVRAEFSAEAAGRRWAQLLGGIARGTAEGVA